MFANPKDLVNDCLDAGLYSIKSMIPDKSLFVAIKALILSKSTLDCDFTFTGTVNVWYILLKTNNIYFI